MFREESGVDALGSSNVNVGLAPLTLRDNDMILLLRNQLEKSAEDLARRGKSIFFFISSSTELKKNYNPPAVLNERREQNWGLLHLFSYKSRTVPPHAARHSPLQLDFLTKLLSVLINACRD